MKIIRHFLTGRDLGYIKDVNIRCNAKNLLNSLFMTCFHGI